MSDDINFQPTSPIGTLSYPALFVAKPNQQYPDGPKKFGATLIYTPEQANEVLTQIWPLVSALLSENWPQYVFDKASMLAFTDETRRQNIRLPFRANHLKVGKDGGPDANYPKGGVYLTFGRKEDTSYPNGNPPQVVDGQHNPILMPSDVYAGCMARVSYHCWAYTRTGNPGISADLDMLQKAGEGDPIGRGPMDPKAAFEKINMAAGDPEDVFNGGGGTFP